MDPQSDNIFENILFNYPKMPSKKNMLVGIPMYLFRVQTSNFKRGLNFFQKAVLKFKGKADFPDELIAEIIGIDLKLVKVIESELVSEKLLNADGSLTEKGRTERHCLNGLIVDPTKKRIGYVLQYINEEKYYPFYIDDFRCPVRTSDPKPMIIGQKGDEFKFHVEYAEEMLEDCESFHIPTERKVLELIKNSGNRMLQDDHEQKGLLNSLSVKFLDDEPPIFWVCTYMYFEDKGNDTYSSDWKVLDPFSDDPTVPENSGALKLYIEENAPELVKAFEEKFGDLETIERKKYREAAMEMDKNIERILLKDFGLLPANMDKKIVRYIKNVIGKRSELIFRGDMDEDIAASFALNLQKIFESIIKKDMKRRPEIYRQESRIFEASKEKDVNTALKQDKLKEIFKVLFDSSVPGPLWNAAKEYIRFPKSLKSYMVAFILNGDYSNKLYLLFISNVDTLLRIANLRNENSHGHIDEDKDIKPLKQEEVEEFYQFLIKFITGYISCYKN